MELRVSCVEGAVAVLSMDMMVVGLRLNPYGGMAGFLVQ